MQKAVFLFLLLSMVAMAPANAELSIVFVNSEQILQSYTAVTSVVQTFNRDVAGWNEEATRQKNEIEELQRSLENQSLMLSDERRQEKEMEYQRKLNEYEQFVQSVWGPGGLVEQRNEDLLRPIISEVQAQLAKLAQEEGYDYIFDAADNNILFADPDYDITEKVIEILNTNSEERND